MTVDNITFLVVGAMQGAALLVLILAARRIRAERRRRANGSTDSCPACSLITEWQRQ